jgi:hypothetical protein
MYSRTVIPFPEQTANIGGLPSMHQAFSTEFPVRGQATTPIGRGLPVTEPGEQGTITSRKHTGNSSSESKVMYGVAMALWDDKHPYHDEIKDGGMVFIISGMTKSESQAQALMNLRHVNEWQREQYTAATAMMSASAGVAPIVASGLLSQNQFDLLLTLPTRQWGKLPFIKEIRSHPEKSKVFSPVDYLIESSASARFNFYGFAAGQMLETQSTKVTAVSRANMIDNVSNYWGNNLKPEMNCFLIFKRLLIDNSNPSSPKYGPFGFWPWAGYGAPTEHQRHYVDYSGNDAKGMVVYIGRLIWWVEDFKPSPEYYLQMTGTVPLKLDILRKNPSPGCLRLLVDTLPGRRLRWWG